jgi:hypothetical protein
MRSQGATMLQSSLFCFAQSCLLEYVWEGGVQQPSIQDLIVTPVLGSLVGELSHVATVKMSKNGYAWYEKAIICFINPAYALITDLKLNIFWSIDSFLFQLPHLSHSAKQKSIWFVYDLSYIL